MATIEVSMELKTLTCASCGAIFAVESNFERSKRENHDTFYCPNGHSQWFPHETEAEKLRKELRRKEQELADQVRAKLEAQAEAEKVNRRLKRVHKGTCPCCKRSFQNLANHMKSKHPELAK